MKINSAYMEKASTQSKGFYLGINSGGIKLGGVVDKEGRLTEKAKKCLRVP